MYIILVNCHLLFEFPEKLTQEAGFPLPISEPNKILSKYPPKFLVWGWWAGLSDSVLNGTMCLLLGCFAPPDRCCDKYSDKGCLGDKGFVPAPDSRLQPVVVAAVPSQPRAEGEWIPACPAQLVLSSWHCPGPSPRWCCPSSGWGFPPQLTQSGKSPQLSLTT